MKITATRRFLFSSSHTNTSCGPRLHGHDWFLEVEVADAHVDVIRGTAVFSPEVIEKIVSLTNELDLRDLNEMVIGAESNPEGIAGWVAERLRAFLPGLRSVTVGFSGYRATIEV